MFRNTGLQRNISENWAKIWTSIFNAEDVGVCAKGAEKQLPPLLCGLCEDLCALCVKAGSFGLQWRLSIGTTRRSPGPVYCDNGRMRRLFASCSMMCAVQPVMRAMTKNGVNMSASKPIM